MCHLRSEWPKQPSFLPDFTCDEPEVKSVKQCFAHVQVSPENVMHRLFARYSNFSDILRAVAWQLRFKQMLYGKCFKNNSHTFLTAVGLLSASELECARIELIKAV